MEWKKIVISIFIGIIIGTSSTLFLGYKQFDRRANEYKNTIDQLGEQLERERARNLQIKELNTKLEQQLRISVDNGRRAEEALGEIGEGLSGDVRDISEVIERLSKVIEILQRYENNE